MQFDNSLFTHAAKLSIEYAVKSAGMMGHTYVGCEHLLLGIATNEQSVGAKILRNHGVRSQELLDALDAVIGSGMPTLLSKNELTPRANGVIDSAVKLMYENNATCVGTDHLLYCIINCGDSFAKKLLIDFKVDTKKLSNDLMNYRANNMCQQQKPQPDRKQNFETLEKYGTNLNRKAQKGQIDPLIGREDELNRLIRTLCRRQKNNPCLVGEPGVGKTAIVEGLALRINEGNVPTQLQDKVIISVDLTALVAGTKYRGDFEERVNKLVKDVTGNPNVILFIDEMHTVIGAGSAEGSVDAANMLKPALTKGNFRVIGATTYSEYRKIVQKDTALERRFQPIYVSEPTVEEAVQIITGLRQKLEEHHNVSISDEAIISAVKLTKQYVTERFLPDKAIDVIDEAAAKVQLNICNSINKGKMIINDILQSEGMGNVITLPDTRQKAVVNENVVKDIVMENCCLAKANILKGEHYVDPKNSIMQMVIGQDEAVERVCSSMRRYMAGIRDETKPIASFLFCGPTGVGKTLLCRTMASQMFGNADNLVKLDMSEYSEKHTISRLIGAPPGYVGYDEGGQLSEPVKKNPYCVVLFDEIEKAHPEIYNILLQILEDGVLTDANGRKVSFTNTVIVLTSNVGSGLVGGVGFNAAKDDKILKSIKQTFKPELLGRMDEIIVFNDLTKENLAKIGELLLKELKVRITKNNYTFFADNNVCKVLANKCANDGGARQMRKIIRQDIENPVSDIMLNGGSGKNIVCTAKGGRIDITVK